ncbi:hypothetical protein GGE07_005046 [Sinorhizobium terangae]|nr:hypothetical protein [Sinorhizobium terangae]
MLLLFIKLRAFKFFLQIGRMTLEINDPGRR